MSAVLEVFDTADMDKWIGLIDALPPQKKDIHYHPKYLKIYENIYGQNALLFVFSSDDCIIMQVGVINEIDRSSHRDLSTVYGYGGPIVSGVLSDTDASKYNDLLLNYFEKIGIVAHFCLLTPFLGSQERQLLQLNKKLTFRKNVAIIDLRRTASDLWSNIDEAQRKAVWHARKSGIEVKVSDLSCADLDSFYQLYIQNMARVEATAFWHFPKSFFHETVNCLSKDNVTLMNALLNGEVISSFFLIHMYDKVFYHFSAAVHRHRKLNANALLMFDCMMWAKAAGFNFFYLGGGSTSEADSLFRFKNSFANNTLELFSSEVVVNKETYEGLVKAAKVEEKRAFGKELVTDFFPRYRAR